MSHTKRSSKGNSAVNSEPLIPEIALGEEELSDVSLATFPVLERRTLQGVRKAEGLPGEDPAAAVAAIARTSRLNLARGMAQAYASQQENSPENRNINRARKIRMRLGGTPNLFDPFPGKPPRMHSRSYLRLKARGEAADAIALGPGVDGLYHTTVVYFRRSWGGARSPPDVVFAYATPSRGLRY